MAKIWKFKTYVQFLNCKDKIVFFLLSFVSLWMDLKQDTKHWAHGSYNLHAYKQSIYVNVQLVD